MLIYIYKYFLPEHTFNFKKKQILYINDISKKFFK